MSMYVAKEKRKDTAFSKAPKTLGTSGAATITDHRSSTVCQRQLQQAMDAHAAAKAIPLQRKASKGSARFQQIATDMGVQYGVDTSRLKATHHSSFPAKLNAEATIQGSNIHFAPGKDTDENIRHEVAHAIDNTMNGTPKGDQVVNGQRVDTTREQVVDRMTKGAMPAIGHGFPVQRKPDQVNHDVFQLKRLASNIDRGKLNVIGEHHNESGRRRNLEKAFTRTKFGANRYWEEYEFSIVHPGHDAKIAGDDFYLRFIMELFLSLLYWGNPNKVYKSLKSAISDYQSVEEFQWDYLKGEKKDREREEEEHLVNKINRAISILFLFPENREKELEKLKIPIMRFLKYGQHIVTYKPTNNGILRSPKQLRRLHREKLDQVSWERSLWMHYAATTATELGNNQKGIWKIGEDHVQDIRYSKYEGNYNLLDKKTFDDILDNDEGLSRWKKFEDILN